MSNLVLASSSSTSSSDLTRPSRPTELDDGTAQLIAQLLAEDLKDLESSVDSKRKNEKGFDDQDTKGSHQAQEDYLLALQFVAKDAQVAADSITAAKMTLSSAAATRRDATAARKDAALNIDHQYALKLQSALQEGNQDEETLRDADSLLGGDAVKRLTLQDPNGKQVDSGGIKTPEVESDASEEDVEDFASGDPESFRSHDLCGICLEPFRPSSDPFALSLSASSSSSIPFGLKLQDCGHGYCLEDLAIYLTSKLGGEGEGLTVVFPIECPSCNDGRDAFDDNAALKILGPDKMEPWAHAREIEARAKFYCPRPSGTQLIPDQDRTEEDGLLFALVKTEKWRRSSSSIILAAIISPASADISSVTYAEKTGTLLPEDAVKVVNSCSDVPPENPQPIAPPPSPPVVVAPPVLQQIDLNGREFFVPDPKFLQPHNIPCLPGTGTKCQDWLRRNGALSTIHPPTSQAVSRRLCPYCLHPCETEQSLCQHLDEASHRVYFCCGRIFKYDKNMDQHRVQSRVCVGA
ncbi:hypothetical protein BDY24DRAFT_418597 [Mrakia frigida]|uniref:uncharacterized protein n=1 Tax=Mrakia frigida TaxID=29902 RepID=UPI003FCBF985